MSTAVRSLKQANEDQDEIMSETSMSGMDERDALKRGVKPDTMMDTGGDDMGMSGRFRLGASTGKEPESIYKRRHPWLSMLFSTWPHITTLWIMVVGAFAITELALKNPGLSIIGWTWVVWSVLLALGVWWAGAAIVAYGNYRSEQKIKAANQGHDQPREYHSLHIRLGGLSWRIAGWAVLGAFMQVFWNGFTHVYDPQETQNWIHLMWATLLLSSLSVFKQFHHFYFHLWEHLATMCCADCYDI